MKVTTSDDERLSAVEDCRDVEFLTLVQGELPRLVRVARVLARNSDDADDLVAEAVAKTLPHWRAKSISNPPVYLRKVVVNLASGEVGAAISLVGATTVPWSGPQPVRIRPQWSPNAIGHSAP